MNYCFITGTSTGLGKAIAELLLKENNTTVHGFSRKQSIKHKRYIHHTVDFTEFSQIEQIKFQITDNCEKAILINNAGIIGDIKRNGNINNQLINKTFTVNTIAPAILCNQFLQAVLPRKISGLIINISSGAASHPIASWSAYCASKAALDMYSRVVQEELNEQNIKHIKVFSVYPGIIDTPMQEFIRSSNENDFSSKNRFIQYKKEGNLTSPELTARKILGIFTGNKLINDVVIDIRDF